MAAHVGKGRAGEGAHGPALPGQWGGPGRGYSGSVHISGCPAHRGRGWAPPGAALRTGRQRVPPSPRPESQERGGMLSPFPDILF